MIRPNLMHRKLPDSPLDNPAGASLAKPRQAKCAKCGNSFTVSDRKFLPFCSLRCQQLDLAAWLDEDYGLPFEGDTTGEVVEYVDQDADEV